MSWKVKFSHNAERYFVRLPKRARRKVKEKLEEIRNIEYPLFHKDVKPLVGKLENFYRLRVGKYRIIFYLLKSEKIIAVVNISPRGDAYK